VRVGVRVRVRVKKMKLACEVCGESGGEDNSFIVTYGRCRGCKNIEEWLEKNVIAGVTSEENFHLNVYFKNGCMSILIGEHIETYETVVEHYECDHCGKTFDDEKEIIEHAKEVLVGGEDE